MRVKLLMFTAALLALPLAGADAQSTVPDFNLTQPNEYELENRRIDEESARQKTEMFRRWENEAEREKLNREISRQREELSEQQRQLDLLRMRRNMPDH